MLRERLKLKRIIDLGLEFARVRDLDILLEKVLLEARNFTNADAGSIYLMENDHLRFSYSQNDSLQQRLPSNKKLIYSTFSVPINHSSIAGHVALTGAVMNIPNVYELPPGPFSFNRSYDDLSGYRTRSMLTFPLQNVYSGVSGVLQLINAKNQRGEVIPFAAEEEPFLVHFANTAAAAVERAKLTRATILRMNKMAELRDPRETGPHVNRVASYSVALYETWAIKRGVSLVEIEQNKDLLRMAAMLHDVGKVAISDTILRKPGRFTPEEFDTMKSHTIHGVRLFADIYSDFDEAAAIVALNHHERWDGKGYPGHVDPRNGAPLPGFEGEKGQALGKKGEDIPLFGRIVAVADVYDALCSRRCYKPAWEEGEVLRELREESGGQFDPEVIDAFFESLDMIHHISSLYPDLQ